MHEPAAEKLPKQFEARLRKSGDHPGAWTYVKMMRAALGNQAGDTVTVKLLERLGR